MDVLLNTMLQCLKQQTTFISGLVTLYTQFYILFVLIGSETQIITFGYITEWRYTEKNLCNLKLMLHVQQGNLYNFWSTFLFCSFLWGLRQNRVPWYSAL